MSYPGQPPPAPAPPGGPVYGPWAPGTAPGPTIDDLVGDSYAGSGGPPRSVLTPPGSVPGTASGGLLTLPGLELPSLEDLIAAATTDPRDEKRRVDDGSPEELFALATDLAEGGGDMTAAAEYSMLAQQQLAESFGNDGTPVYDQSAHLANLPKNFPDAGQHMISTGVRMADSAHALIDTQQKAQTTWESLLAGLDGKAAQLSDHIRAAIDPASGLVPLTAMPALQANRDTLAAFMQVDVNAAGKTMYTRRMTYQTVARQVLNLLADIGYVPPDALNAGPGDVDYTAEQAATDGRALDATLDAATANGADLNTLPAIDTALAQIERLNAAEAAGGTLTDAQQQYRRDFYNALGSESLARLEGTITAAAPTQASLDSTLATAANGITNLSQYKDGAYVPAAVTNLLPGRLGPDGSVNRLGREDGMALPGAPFSRTPDRNPDGTLAVDGLAGYVGVTDLLGHATAPADTKFLNTLGAAAIAAKQDLNSIGPLPSDTSRPFTAADQAVLDSSVAAGESASNTLLNLVAGDTTASQNLLHNPELRHGLIGAGWTDGTGAAAVLNTATAPVQPDQPTAYRGADLTRTLMTELGNDPQAWRELIPKGSDVSNALTQLGMTHIGSFSTAPTDVSSFDGYTATPDGRWAADFTIGHGSDGSREGIDYIKFLAAGSDPAAPAGDRDMQAIRGAAELHSTNEIAAALAADPAGHSTRQAVGDAGSLRGILDQGQFEAVIDQNADANAADGAIAKDGIYGARAAARVIAETVVSELPGGGIAKQLFNLTADEFANRTGAPDPTAGQDLARDLLRNDIEWRDVNDNHLLAGALVQADPTFRDRNSTLFDPSGTLLPPEAIGTDQNLVKALEAAMSRVGEPTDGRPPVPLWDEGRNDLRNSYDDYRAEQYQPAPDAPAGSFDEPTQHRIRHGDRP